MRVLLATALAVWSSAAFGQAGPGADIGIAEWVNPSATGMPPRADVRRIREFDKVIERERVTTNAEGIVDFIFYNESRLLVGPGCEVVLDHLYYDQQLDIEVKEFSLDTTFRCVTKADNKDVFPPDVMVIKTPQGDIIVRNANASVGLSPDDMEVVTGPMGPGGQVEVRTPNDKVVMRRDNSRIRAEVDGRIAKPRAVPRTEMKRIQRRFEDLTLTKPPARLAWELKDVPPREPRIRQDCIFAECDRRPRRDGVLVPGGNGKPLPREP